MKYWKPKCSSVGFPIIFLSNNHTFEHGIYGLALLLPHLVHNSQDTYSCDEFLTLLLAVYDLQRPLVMGTQLLLFCHHSIASSEPAFPHIHDYSDGICLWKLRDVKILFWSSFFFFFFWHLLGSDMGMFIRSY